MHSKQGVFKEGPSMGGGADPAAPTRGGADPATSTNSTDAKGKLPKTPRSMHCTVSHTCLGIKETEKLQDAGSHV